MGLDAAVLLLEAAGLPVGGSMRVPCPFCRGPGRSLSVTREPTGILYNCYRASCGTAGHIATAGHLLTAERRDAEPELKPWTEPQLPLEPADYAYFGTKYELDKDITGMYISRAEDGRYLLPALNARGHERGIIARVPWDGAPRATAYGGPKAVAYWHAHGPRQALYRGVNGPSHKPTAITRRVLLVEDQLSAIMASQTGLFAWTVSMLKPREVIIAFDADASERGFRWARKWGLAFPKTRVAMLERDIKDTPMYDIADALGIEE
jgi:hypothetical protein